MSQASSKPTLETNLLTHKFHLADYYHMTKPTITLLVVITALPGILLASPQLPSILSVLVTFFGTALASSSAAVFNQIIEMDVDQSMTRTRKRSLPSGKVSLSAALLFGFGLLGLGELMLYYFATPMAALIALAGHLFYVIVYTMILKKLTPQNIVIGGAAGAIGPLIGWASVDGQLDWPAWVLFLIITLWTPPHFWALALKYKEDYFKASIPMYPVIYGDEKTRKVMMFYSLSLIPTVLSLYIFDKAGLIYLAAAILLTGKFVWDSVRLYLDHNNDKAMAFFHFSCFYTFGLFGALAFDRIWLLMKSL